MGNLRLSGRSISLHRARLLSVGNRFLAHLMGVGILLVLAPGGLAQTEALGSPLQSAVPWQKPGRADLSAVPLTITLQDALVRAQKNDSQLLGALGEAKSANEDRLQARNARLPSVIASTQYLNTQGNGGKTPEGRFVTNDGVHVYRQWAVLHEDLSSDTYLATGLHRAAAAEALARAHVEIVRRGLVVTVTKAYYTLAASQHKYATAQQILEQSSRFFSVSQAQEQAGQAAHSDVIKAEIQYRQQQQAFEESKLAMEEARLDLAVLVFPTLNENFNLVDDLDAPQSLPSFSEAQLMAGKENPDLRVALETLAESNSQVLATKGAFLPSLSIEADYGIEANDFALHAIAKAHPTDGYLPTLGYFLTANLTIPVWDWGTMRSKLHQAKYQQEQARHTLSETERRLLSHLYAFYDEVTVAREAAESSRHTADLATESLRLNLLRYQSGEAAALEVVDAQNTLTTARNTCDDAGLRYRVAIANLQTLTGDF